MCRRQAMMERGIGLVVGLVLLAQGSTALAVSNVRRETTTRRPYIQEVGEPYEIGMHALWAEARDISELGDYLRDYGTPDYAEIQETEPQWPWRAREVRIYYMRRNLEA